MPKPICVKCKRFYRPHKNAIWVGETAPVYNGVLPGTLDEGNWRPYKVWHADLWKCQGCQHEIIVGFGKEPVSVQHEENFANWQSRVEYTVNDC